MRSVRISEISMKQKSAAELTFREKLELAKLFGRLGLDVIETAPLGAGRADSLLVKSIAQTVTESIIAVPAGLDSKSIENAWESVKDAARPRLQVICPVSSVQMEYLLHEKAGAVKDTRPVTRMRPLRSFISPGSPPEKEAIHERSN